MAILHLNCASFRIHAPFFPSRMVAHVLVVETGNGLVLVDSGFGVPDVSDKRLSMAYKLLIGAQWDPTEPAVVQLQKRGYDPRDVTDIVLTHMDSDHAGGISDFPEARIHVLGTELDAAQAGRGGIGSKLRYIPAQWAHQPHWVAHSAGGDKWNGFDSVRTVGENVQLIPMAGHTWGHCAVAVQRPNGGWYLHAGDAYFSAGEKETPPRRPSGMEVFQKFMAVDGKARVNNQERLRELHASAADVTIFSAHDVTEYEALKDLTD